VLISQSLTHQTLTYVRLKFVQPTMLTNLTPCNLAKINMNRNLRRNYCFHLLYLKVRQQVFSKSRKTLDNLQSVPPHKTQFFSTGYLVN